MQSKGLSASTIKTELAAMRFFHDNMPYTKEVLPTNDELNLKHRTFGGVDRTWTAHEFNFMIAAAMEKVHTDYIAILALARYAGLRLEECFRLAILSGFRCGELCGLTLDNIDFENQVITIEKALYHITRQGDILETPKTANSNRSLRLSDEIFKLLRKLQEFYEGESARLGTKWNETDFVFKRADGNVISPTSPNEWLHKFCEQEGLKYVVPHSFRHLNASILINSGASVKTVQACLGHSVASTTLDIYARAFSKSQAMASQAVANSFKLS
ncbi:MAG: site-specific integrase [Oscillospiraceae bacterium]|nr:site-specific integrase [Oscillospiraceae bacterium]